MTTTTTKNAVSTALTTPFSARLFVRRAGAVLAGLPYSLTATASRLF